MDRTRWRRWMETRGPKFIAIAEQATMFDVPVKLMPRREVVALLGYLLVKAKADEHRRGPSPRTWFSRLRDRLRGRTMR